MSLNLNAFEEATRKDIRFESPKGHLTVQDLWKLPLKSTTGAANLDDIARRLNRSLKDSEQESFVDTTAAPFDPDVVIGFEVVKRIIQVRIAERDAKILAEAERTRKNRIRELIESKKDQELGSKSIAELEELLK